MPPPIHSSPPPTGSIVKGKVERIESYGAFISLIPTDSSDGTRDGITNYNHRGLLHISQLSSYKVDSVEDCLSLDDIIYVKVLNCEEEELVDGDRDRDRNVNMNEDRETRRRIGIGGKQRRKRYKVSLSLKYASQDGNYVDLDPNNEQYERETRGRMMRGSSQHDNRNKQSNIPSALETSLNSQLGMGIAIDPLAAMNQANNTNYDESSSHLILRNKNTPTSGKIIINGYALVDDNEGEQEKTITETSQRTQEATIPQRPVGRGRGATLPAWMTNNNKDDNGPTGMKCNDTDLSRSRSRSVSSSDYSKERNHKRKKSRKKEDKKRHRHDKKRKSKHSSSKHSRRSKSKRRYSYDDSSDQDNDSRYDDDVNDGNRERKRRRRRRDRSESSDEGNRRRYENSSKQKSHKRSSRFKREDEQNDSDYSRDSSSKPIFRDVEEAKRLIAKLEGKPI
mmetsp:Transcript_26509/g.30818  ORF Transcript_26509/g.30818 Transcript_26509/m.30818 type:complete len:451 (-) Transcript_26509:170-1522(-)